MTHVIHFEDADGNLTDVEYCCGWGCMHTRLRVELLPLEAEIIGVYEWRSGQGGLTWGAAPCATSDLDHDVHCASCGQLLHVGEVSA